MTKQEEGKHEAIEDLTLDELRRKFDELGDEDLKLSDEYARAQEKFRVQNTRIVTPEKLVEMLDRINRRQDEIIIERQKYLDEIERRGA